MLTLRDSGLASPAAFQSATTHPLLLLHLRIPVDRAATPGGRGQPLGASCLRRDRPFASALVTGIVLRPLAPGGRRGHLLKAGTSVLPGRLGTLKGVMPLASTKA